VHQNYKKSAENRLETEQLFDVIARGVKVLIAPCHNWHGGLEDINHHYGLGLDIKFICDILYDVIEKPEAIEE